jgi:hypothetical protein
MAPALRFRPKLEAELALHGVDVGRVHVGRVDRLFLVFSFIAKRIGLVLEGVRLRRIGGIVGGGVEVVSRGVIIVRDIITGRVVPLAAASREGEGSSTDERAASSSKIPFSSAVADRQNP